jgi:hypothetical protein
MIVPFLSIWIGWWRLEKKKNLVTRRVMVDIHLLSRSVWLSNLKKSLVEFLPVIDPILNWISWFSTFFLPFDRRWLGPTDTVVGDWLNQCLLFAFAPFLPDFKGIDWFQMAILDDIVFASFIGFVHTFIAPLSVYTDSFGIEEHKNDYW